MPFCEIRWKLGLLPAAHAVWGVPQGAHVQQPASTADVQRLSIEQMDLRIGWRATATTELSLEGFNLLYQRHLEANNPSTYLPQYVPRAFMLNLRQSL